MLTACKQRDNAMHAYLAVILHRSALPTVELYAHTLLAPSG